MPQDPRPELRDLSQCLRILSQSSAGSSDGSSGSPRIAQISSRSRPDLVQNRSTGVCTQTATDPFKPEIPLENTKNGHFSHISLHRVKNPYKVRENDENGEKVSFAVFFVVSQGFPEMPGISQKNSIVFVFFYCSPTAKRRPKNTPKWTLPHQMIHFWFSRFPGMSKCRVKNDVFVGDRTSKSKNRSPVWPVICKVFCRIKWSIISGASIWGGPLESREMTK